VTRPATYDFVSMLGYKTVKQYRVWIVIRRYNGEIESLINTEDTLANALLWLVGCTQAGDQEVIEFGHTAYDVPESLHPGMEN